MAKKKKNIKIEKFSPFTFLIICSIFIGLIFALTIKINFFEYYPQTNLFGESGLIKEPKEPIPYNQGDIFRPLLGMFFWVCSTFIIVFIINIFNKNFLYKFIRTFGYSESKKSGDFYRYQFWLWWLIAVPIGFSIIIMLFSGLIHFINNQFNISISNNGWVLSLWLIWLLWLFGSPRNRKK
jgi:hypothetical protein